jgi:hypothetical protein
MPRNEWTGAHEAFLQLLANRLQTDLEIHFAEAEGPSLLFRHGDLGADTFPNLVLPEGRLKIRVDAGTSFSYFEYAEEEAKYADRQVWANSADFHYEPEQVIETEIPPNKASTGSPQIPQIPQPKHEEYLRLIANIGPLYCQALLSKKVELGSFASM